MDDTESFPDFIPVGGPSSVAEPWRNYPNYRPYGRGGFRGRQEFRGNNRFQGGGGPRPYRGNQSYGRGGYNQYPHANQQEGPSNWNYQGNYQPRGGRGDFRPQHSSGDRFGNRSHAGDRNAHISTYCNGALENPWMKLEAAQLPKSDDGEARSAPITVSRTSPAEIDQSDEAGVQSVPDEDEESGDLKNEQP